MPFRNGIKCFGALGLKARVIASMGLVTAIGAGYLTTVRQLMLNAVGYTALELSTGWRSGAAISR
jgi:hypothetical protein